MRAYTVATAALAMNANPKWLDNFLSHHHVPDVKHSQRGVRRRLAPRSVLTIALARRLSTDLSTPLHRALELAVDIVEGNSATLQVSDTVLITVDLERFTADLLQRLDDAAEFAAVPRRGRPPRARGPLP